MRREWGALWKAHPGPSDPSMKVPWTQAFCPRVLRFASGWPALARGCVATELCHLLNRQGAWSADVHPWHLVCKHTNGHFAGVTVLCNVPHGFHPALGLHKWEAISAAAGKFFFLPELWGSGKVIQQRFHSGKRKLSQTKGERKKPQEFILSFELPEHLIQRGTVPFLFLIWYEAQSQWPACLVPEFLWKCEAQRGSPGCICSKYRPTKGTEGAGQNLWAHLLLPTPSPVPSPSFQLLHQDKVKLGLRGPFPPLWRSGIS